MTDRPHRIARVRLARSLPRLLALPVLLLLVGAGLAAYGLLVSPMPAGLLFVAAGALLALLGVGWSVRLLSIRLDVEEAAVTVRMLGGGHRYALTPGAVTRVRLRGEDASALRASTSALGWALGRARLRNEEQIHVVRLAPTPTAILVPTRDGRLAIAARDEQELLEALTQAARARQRTAQAAQAVLAAEAAEAAAAAEAASVAAEAPIAPPSPGATTEAAPQPEPAPAAPPEPLAPEPRFMTGIERSQYEARLAEARETGALAAVAVPAPSEAAARPAEPAPAADALVRAPTVEAPAIEPRERRRRLPRPALRRPTAATLAVLLPIVGAGVVWAVAWSGDRLPAAESDLGRLTSLALVLAGPASMVGAIVARVWWPRLVAAVVVAGLAASVLIARALLT